MDTNVFRRTGFSVIFIPCMTLGICGLGILPFTRRCSTRGYYGKQPSRAFTAVCSCSTWVRGRRALAATLHLRWNKALSLFLGTGYGVRCCTSYFWWRKGKHNPKNLKRLHMQCCFLRCLQTLTKQSGTFRDIFWRFT